MPARPALCPDYRHRLGVRAPVLPLRSHHQGPAQTLAPTRQLPHRLATTRPTLRAIARHQLGQDPPRRLQKAVKKGGADTGPSPVDRSKCGTAIHLATEEHGLPLGAVVTAAGANDGVQAQAVLEAMVVQPPPAETPVANPDPRDLPRARADGAYGNRPTQARANAAGFRMEAPKRGRPRPAGVGTIRSAVERGHAFFAQFGRIARRFDRSSRRFLGWVQLAAALIFVRAEAHGFFQPRTVMNGCFSP